MTAPSGGLRATWPVHRRQSVLLLCGWVTLTVVWIGLGTLLTGPLVGGVVVRAGERVANWMIAMRTPTWDHVTTWGSLLAETTTKVLVTAVLAMVFLWLWRRWSEPVLLVVSLVIEAVAFIVVTRSSSACRGCTAACISCPTPSLVPSWAVLQSHPLQSCWPGRPRAP